MKKGVMIVTATALVLGISGGIADAQRRAPARKSSTRSGAETGLLGIKLFDSGVRVVQIYGSPIQIQPIAVGGGTVTGGGGGGGGGFGGARGGKGSNAGAGGGGGVAPSADSNSPNPPAPFADLDGAFGQRGAPGGAPAPSAGPPGAAGAGGGGAPSGAGGGAGGGVSGSSEYARWVYVKNGSRFGFVLDKFNRVVQIEAVGLQNNRVKTKRGISFGSSFAQVMKAYGPSSAPDGYDVNGDTVTIKFLTRQRVAFRLSKLGSKQSQVVTGIVIAAGKA